VRGGALFNGKEGRGDFRKTLFGKRDGVIRKTEIQKKLIQSVFYLRNQLPSMGNNPNIAIGMFPQKRFYDRSE
jgi:hypothetical protein